MPTTAQVQNFQLLPSGEVLLQLCRTLRGRDSTLARANVMFRIAATYWSPSIFVADGQGGWKDPITGASLDEFWLANKIKQVIDLQITQDQTFKAAYNSAIEAIANTPQGATAPPILWPTGGIPIMNETDIAGFASGLRTETYEEENRVENSDKSEISLGTADTHSNTASMHDPSTSTYAAFSLAF